MSQGLWPAKTYTVSFLLDSFNNESLKPMECYNTSSGMWSSTEECHQWYGNNTISLFVYYEQANSYTGIESGSYDVV